MIEISKILSAIVTYKNEISLLFDLILNVLAQRKMVVLMVVNHQMGDKCYSKTPCVQVKVKVKISLHTLYDCLELYTYCLSSAVCTGAWLCAIFHTFRYRN